MSIFDLEFRKRASKLEGGFAGSYGSYDAAKGTLYQGAKIGRFDYRISGTLNNYDGKTGWHNAYHNGSILFRSGYTGPTFNADILYYQSHGTKQMQWGEILLPTTLANGTLDYSKVGTMAVDVMTMNKMVSNLGALNLSKSWNDSQKTTIQYAFNELEIEVNKLDQSSHEQNFGVKHAIKFYNNALTAGGQYLIFVNPRGVAPNVGRRVDQDMFSMFVQDEYRMFNNKLTVDGGLRFDKIHYDNSAVTGLPLNEWAEPTYTYGFGGSYKLSRPLTWTARYAYSQNGLSSNQVSPTGATLPGENRSRVETGVYASLRSYFNPSLSLFYYDTQNQKVSTTGKDPKTGKSVTSYIDATTGEEVDFVTVSNVVTGGAELGVSGKVKSAWNYKLSYTYVATDNNTTNKDMSHHLFSARLGYQYRSLFANMSAAYVGPKSRSSSPMGVIYYTLGDYTRVDLNLGCSHRILDRDARITFFVRNLGDNNYATRYVTGAYKDVGRQLGVELAISFF